MAGSLPCVICETIPVLWRSVRHILNVSFGSSRSIDGTVSWPFSRYFHYLVCFSCTTRYTLCFLARLVVRDVCSQFSCFSFCTGVCTFALFFCRTNSYSKPFVASLIAFLLVLFTSLFTKVTLSSTTMLCKSTISMFTLWGRGPKLNSGCTSSATPSVASSLQ